MEMYVFHINVYTCTNVLLELNTPVVGSCTRESKPILEKIEHEQSSEAPSRTSLLHLAIHYTGVTCAVVTTSIDAFMEFAPGISLGEGDVTLIKVVGYPVKSREALEKKGVINNTLCAEYTCMITYLLLLLTHIEATSALFFITQI